MIRKEFIDISTPVLPLQEFDKNWCATDSRENFENLLKKKPLDWIYRTKKVQYNWNELGYRTPSFNSVNWKNSILVFGDSQVLGVGLDESECIRHHMSNLSGVDIVSLAAAGSSGMFQWANSVKLKRWIKDTNPLAVIIIWPTWERFFIKEKNKINHIGGWTTEEWKINLLNEQNIEIYNKLARESFLEIWKDSFVIECRAKIKDCWKTGLRVGHLEDDKARDDQHLGPIWANQQAESWIQELKEKGII